MNVGNQTAVATRLANYDISQNISFDFFHRRKKVVNVWMILSRHEADAIVTLRVYVVIDLTVTAGDCSHIRVISINETLIFSDLHWLNITVLHDFALFL